MQDALPNSFTKEMTSVSNRHCGLDALRGLAAICVVILHAGIPYMTHPLPHLVWPVRDAHPSPVVDGVIWFAECFLMPLFFLLAGFFSMGLLNSRSEIEFIVGRTRRLIWTLLAVGPIVLPLCLHIWSLGLVANGVYAPADWLLRGIPKEIEIELFGLGHLWFLLYLYIYCLALGSIVWMAQACRMQVQKGVLGRLLRRIEGSLASPWKPLVLAIPGAAILFVDPRVVVGFYQTFAPVSSKLVYYSLYFFAGVILFRNRDSLARHNRYGVLYSLVGVVAFVDLLPLIHSHMAGELTVLEQGRMAILLSSFASLGAYGLFFVFHSYRQFQSPALKYLADASFWVYIIHLPFVALAQIAVGDLSLPALAKFVLVSVIGVALSLATYQAFVRGRWLGDFLDGKRQLRTAGAPPLTIPAPGFAAGLGRERRPLVSQT